MRKSLLDQKRDIIERKLEVDARIQEINLELAQAAARYNKTGRGMPTEYYFKLKSELTRLKPTSQRLQMELGLIKDQIHKGEMKSLGEHFIEVARLELSTNQFNKILRLAVELRDGEQ